MNLRQFMFNLCFLILLCISFSLYLEIFGFGLLCGILLAVNQNNSSEKRNNGEENEKDGQFLTRDAYQKTSNKHPGSVLNQSERNVSFKKFEESVMESEDNRNMKSSSLPTSEKKEGEKSLKSELKFSASLVEDKNLEEEQTKLPEEALETSLPMNNIETLVSEEVIISRKEEFKPTDNIQNILKEEVHHFKTDHPVTGKNKSAKRLKPTEEDEKLPILSLSHRNNFSTEISNSPLSFESNSLNSNTSDASPITFVEQDPQQKEDIKLENSEIDITDCDQDSFGKEELQFKVDDLVTENNNSAEILKSTEVDVNFSLFLSSYGNSFSDGIFSPLFAFELDSLNLNTSDEDTPPIIIADEIAQQYEIIKSTNITLNIVDSFQTSGYSEKICLPPVPDTSSGKKSKFHTSKTGLFRSWFTKKSKTENGTSRSDCVQCGDAAALIKDEHSCSKIKKRLRCWFCIPCKY